MLVFFLSYFILSLYIRILFVFKDGSPDRMGDGEGLGGVEGKSSISGYMILGEKKI